MPCLVGWSYVGETVAEESGSTCSTTALPALTSEIHDSGVTSDGTTVYYTGFEYTGSGTTICKISPYIRRNGDMTGNTVYVEVWTTSDGDLDTKQADLASVDATTLPTGIDYFDIEFSTPYTISNSEVIVLTTNASQTYPNTMTTAYQRQTDDASDQAAWWGTSAGVRDTSDYGDFRMMGYVNE